MYTNDIEKIAMKELEKAGFHKSITFEHTKETDGIGREKYLWIIKIGYNKIYYKKFLLFI